jgi:hypothetical protein
VLFISVDAQPAAAVASPSTASIAIEAASRALPFMMPLPADPVSLASNLVPSARRHKSAPRRRGLPPQIAG